MCFRLRNLPAWDMDWLWPRIFFLLFFAMLLCGHFSSGQCTCSFGALSHFGHQIGFGAGNETQWKCRPKWQGRNWTSEEKEHFLHLNINQIIYEIIDWKCLSINACLSISACLSINYSYNFL